MMRELLREMWLRELAYQREFWRDNWRVMLGVFSGMAAIMLDQALGGYWLWLGWALALPALRYPKWDGPMMLRALWKRWRVGPSQERTRTHD